MRNNEIATENEKIFERLIQIKTNKSGLSKSIIMKTTPKNMIPPTLNYKK